MHRVVAFVVLLVGVALPIASSRTAAQAYPCDPASPSSCLYYPSGSYSTVPPSPSLLRETTYTDIGGRLRTVRMAFRVPLGAPEPMPVVIWSHGGAYGQNDPQHVAQEWSQVTARAGYLTVSVAHEGRRRASREALCAAAPLLVDPIACENFKFLQWDRPHDLAAVMSELERLNGTPEFLGKIDLSRIALAGHSAGAGGIVTVAGADRRFTNVALDSSDPRPVAFVALSPQGPGAEGFFDTDFGRPEHSWVGVARPVLALTGDGDATCDAIDEPGSCFGNSPFIRRVVFERLPAGDKYQMYVKDSDVFHALFDLKTSECAAKGVDAATCTAAAEWLTSTTLAFLDAHVRRDVDALTWLQSDAIERASLGVVQWLRK